MRKTYLVVTLLLFLSLSLLGVTLIASADGTETLGPPSIPIASGSRIVAEGVGLETQPATMTLNVPAGSTIKQVLLYWAGGDVNNPAGDNTLTINGNSVTGTLIGGPAFFFNRGGQAYQFTSYRADITSLGLISPGTNTLTLSDLVLAEEDGASVVVIYENGEASDIDLRDGLDLAFLGFPEPRKSTVPQTFTFPADSENRVAEVLIIAGSVEPDRPSVVRVTVNGTVTEFVDLLESIDGADWDTFIIPVDVPAGATELTVEVQSIDDPTSRRPASLVWVGAGLSILPPSLGSIGDTVWEDSNANGQKEPGEPELEDVTVNLLNPGPDNQCGTADDVFIDSRVTDGNGRYLFGGLEAGTYCVNPDETTVPPGYVLTTNNDPQTVELNAGENFLDADFGYRPSSELGTIGDTVWQDGNGNGVQDPGEPGIANVTVNLRNPGTDGQCGTADDGTIASDMTDADGNYLFSDLAAATYCVDPDEATVPADYTLTTNNDPETVDLGQGEVFLDADFGYRPPAGPQGAIGDTVWEDDNDNSVQDPGEPGIADVTVNLLTPGADGVCGTADDTALASDTTDANGNYLFSDLDAGTYCVNPDETTVPANYVLTTNNDPETVTLAEGETFLDADFGYRLRSSTCVNFSDFVPGTSVEGLGTVDPNINISSNGGEAVATIVNATDPQAIAYGAPNGPGSMPNGGMPDSGGFFDRVAKNVPNSQLTDRGPNLTFTFAPGKSYGSFSLRLLDFGDWNPVKAGLHQASLVAYDVNNNELFTDTLRFASDSTANPTVLFSQTGDAVTALPGEPGRYFFKAFDPEGRIVRLELRFQYEKDGVVYENSSSDPFIGFTDLCFGPPPPPPICLDFSALEPGSSIEGLGTVQELLNISSNGGAAVATEAGITNPSLVAYGAPNGAGSNNNGGMPGSGGFFDSIANDVPGSQLMNRGPNLSFSFAPDVQANYFTLRLLDFGDWNPVRGDRHAVSLVAYDAADNVVASESLRFASDGTPNPAALFDRFGDAVSALPGEPGNYLFTLFDFFNDKTFDRLELSFSYERDGVTYENSSSDPFIGFADVCFSPLPPESPQ